MAVLPTVDREVHALIQRELSRQCNQLEMIASENIVSAAVLEAQGSVFTNKYAEGYPNRRYYSGCEVTDEVESLAIARAGKLFDAEFVNVQPHSGSQANMAVYFALLKPGDTVLGMNLAHGGHLTHGSPVSFSGKLFNFLAYGVDRETETIDMAEVERLAETARPKLIVVGASAYSRHYDFAGFRTIADNVGALLMVDMAHFAGLVAAGVHPSPVPIADVVTSTTHKTLRGPRGGLILAKEQYGKALNATIFPGIQGGPCVHVIAAKAVAFKEALEPAYIRYQQHVIDNARLLASFLQEKGFRIVSGGTDNHLMLIDLNSKDITGNDATDLLEDAGLTVNKNAIPFDTRPPAVTSGIRIGTPAVTTRGLTGSDMAKIAGWIDRVITRRDRDENRKIREEVKALCRQFPVYQELDQSTLTTGCGDEMPVL